MDTELSRRMFLRVFRTMCVPVFLCGWFLGGILKKISKNFDVWLGQFRGFRGCSERARYLVQEARIY